MIALLLVLATLVMRVGLVVVIALALVVIAWLLWDCMAGPSAQVARDVRRRALGVHGR